MPATPSAIIALSLSMSEEAAALTQSNPEAAARLRGLATGLRCAIALLSRESQEGHCLAPGDSITFRALANALEELDPPISPAN